MGIARANEKFEAEQHGNLEVSQGLEEISSTISPQGRINTQPVLNASDRELQEGLPVSRQRESLIADTEHISVNEIQTYLELVASNQGVEVGDIVFSLQEYMNTVGQKFLNHQELSEYITFGLPVRTDGKLIGTDRSRGRQSTQLLHNIRTCRYILEHGGSQFAEDGAEIRESGYEAILSCGPVGSVSQITALVEKIPGGSQAGLLERAAGKCTEFAIPHTSPLTMNSEFLTILHKIRTANTIQEAEGHKDFGNRRWRWRNFWLKRDDSLYVNDDDIERDGLDRQLKRIDRGRTIDRMRDRISAGTARKQLGSYRDTFWNHANTIKNKRLLLQAAETTGIAVGAAKRAYDAAWENLKTDMRTHPIVKDWILGSYSTYCIRSMRENFEKIGVNIRDDYPVGRVGDPARNHEIVGSLSGTYPADMLNQDASAMLRYYIDKPEYFQPISLKGIPQEQHESVMNLIEEKLYTMFYETGGVAAPLLSDRTRAGHGSICYLDESGNLMVADSYYMPDGRSGSIRDYIKALWGRMQHSNSPEGVLLLPQFSYAKSQE